MTWLHLITSAHLAYIIFFEIISADTTTHLLHGMWCLFITSMSFDYISSEMTWPHLPSHLMSSHFIVRHPISQPFVSSHHVSSEKMCHGATPSATKHLSHGLRKPAKAVEFWGHKLWILIPFQPQVVRLFLEDLKNKLRMAKSGTFEQWEKKGMEDRQ